MHDIWPKRGLRLSLKQADHVFDLALRRVGAREFASKYVRRNIRRELAESSAHVQSCRTDPKDFERALKMVAPRRSAKTP